MHKLFALLRLTPKFVLAYFAGAFTVVAIQWLVPNWRYEKLHYQKGELSIHTLVRVNPYTGEVERLITSEPAEK